MIVQKFTEPRSISSGCKIILTSNSYCMGGGVRLLINKAHISLITGMMNEVWTKNVKLLKKHFSRLLTKEDGKGPKKRPADAGVAPDEH